jgi:hypothetical protein
MSERSDRVENLFQSVVALQGQLREAGILSAVIGGVAVGVWGEPRVTRDVDVKVLLGRDAAPRLLEAISHDYVSLQADPLAALTRTGVLFVQDAQGTRLDLLLSDVSFDAEAIRRARDVTLQPGLVASVCSPEDLIIYKLISTRQRDHDDAESVVRRQGDALDDEYVLTWLRRFEEALDDSTLVATYRRMRARWS